MRKLKKYIIAAVVFVAANAIAGPFGLSKGMTLEELKKQGDFVLSKDQFVYTAKLIASGHPDFETYNVILTPAQGVCKIQAMSKDIETSSFGTELASKHKSLTDAMSEKYGSSAKKYDFLNSGSIWKEPQYWMMGLLKKDRNLVTFWGAPENKNLPDSLKTITNEAVALSTSKGYIRLAYEFDNLGECLAILQTKRNSSL